MAAGVLALGVLTGCAKRSTSGQPAAPPPANAGGGAQGGTTLPPATAGQTTAPEPPVGGSAQGDPVGTPAPPPPREARLPPPRPPVLTEPPQGSTPGPPPHHARRGPASVGPVEEAGPPATRTGSVAGGALAAAAGSAGTLTGAAGGAVSVADDPVEAALASLKTGNLAYQTPPTLKTGETGHVTARLAGGKVSVETLTAGMGGDSNGKVVTAATPVSPLMKMTLTSGDFDITPLSSEEQMVGGTTPTEWQWDVVPRKAGELQLHLAAKVELNGSLRDYPVQDRTVLVKVDATGAVEKFVAGNIPWLVGGVGSALAAAFAWWKKRRSPAAAA